MHPTPIRIATGLSLMLIVALFLVSLAMAKAPNPPRRDHAAVATRVPAEWEPHAATWMQWPRWFERSYRPAFAEIIRALTAYEPMHIVAHSNSYRDEARAYLTQRGVPLDNVTFHVMRLDSAWMRDNGPVWVDFAGQLVVQDWGFDGWGDLTPYFELDDAIPEQVADRVGVPVQDWNAIIHERGNLEFNGTDTVIVNWACLGNRNPQHTEEELTRVLQQAFGVSRVVMLRSATSDDETDGHVDGLARFIDESTVVIPRHVNTQHPDAWVYDEAASIVTQAGLDVIRMDIPGEVVYGGYPMAAVYVNWLVANDVVIMPGFGQPAWDAAAKASVESYFPGRDVHVIDTRELWFFGGSVHCVTNDQPMLRDPRAQEVDGLRR